MLNYPYITDYPPQGTIVYVQDKYHQNKAPYLIINSDECGYGKPFLAFRITSQDKREMAEKDAYIPIYLNKSIGFICLGEVYKLTRNQILDANPLRLYVRQDLIDLCIHSFISRLGLYDKNLLKTEIDSYLENFNEISKNNPKIPYKKDISAEETEITKKLKELNITFDTAESTMTTETRSEYKEYEKENNKKEVEIKKKETKKEEIKIVDKVNRHRFTKFWTTQQLIEWTNDKAKLSLKNMEVKYGITSSHTIYSRNRTVLEELKTRGITV